MAEWKSYIVKVPGKDLLEPVREILETLLVYLEVLKSILDTIKTFLIDFGNPIKALVLALIKLIEELLQSLKASGLFGYFDVPNPLRDPNFTEFKGGYGAFTYRFKGSLFDTGDYNRPQPRTGSTKSGFVLICVEASTIIGLLRLLKQLLRFFGKGYHSPRYEAPANFKALPVGSNEDPILAVASIFSKEIKAIELQWSLPTTKETPDPGFLDGISKIVDEFIPPSFLIERSTVAPTQPLNAASSTANEVNLALLTNPDSVGIVEYDRETEFTIQGHPGQRVTRREQLRDDLEEPIIKFQKYVLIDGVEIESILGQLGKFRYIDTDIELDQTYYYRVRAYSGDIDVVDLPNGKSYVNFHQPALFPELPYPVMEWPSKAPDDAVIIGKPTAILQVRVPKVIPDFDVIEVLKRLFQTAFSLDFHQPLDHDSQFDQNGFPVDPTPVSQVGRGSMLNLAGTLAAFQSFPVLGILAQLEAAGKSAGTPDEITGKPTEMPWTKFSVRRQSRRLADVVASALLQTDQTNLFTLRDFMQGAFPAGIPDSTLLPPAGTQQNLQETLFQFTAVGADGDATAQGPQRYQVGYTDAIFRLNVLTVIKFLQSFTLGGRPPDWISVVPLRDIIPWAGQIIYDLLDAIQKLLNAWQSVMDEIKNFIELIERKIDALERFIKYLIRILDFIDQLQIGAFVLSATGISGNATEWATIVDTAGGTRPTDNPNGYAAGIALAYVGTDVTAFENAFKIIFG